MLSSYFFLEFHHGIAAFLAKDARMRDYLILVFLTSVVVAASSTAASYMLATTTVVSTATSAAILVSVTGKPAVKATLVATLVTAALVIVASVATLVVVASAVTSATALVVIITSAVALAATITASVTTTTVPHVASDTESFLVKFFLRFPVRSIISAFGLFGGLAGNAVEEGLLLVVESVGVDGRGLFFSLDFTLFNFVVFDVRLSVGF